MTHLVYPGALHTRFHHALGSMHLMGLAIETLRAKGIDFTDTEDEALRIAILLHDIGHGPFSHALEQTIVPGVHHESLSALFMARLNQQFNGALSMAIAIFNGTYHRRFMHQLVSSQLDMDRMDYLNRDSFFTGVTEGVIGFDRIIKMLNVVDDHVVVEEKGVYSIEKFLIARRLMYWQVYLHKTVIAAEQMLGKILHRARHLALSGQHLFATPALLHFLKHEVTMADFSLSNQHLDTFARLDDGDLMASIKVWINHPDFILSKLSQDLFERNLYHVEISNTEVPLLRVEELAKQSMQRFGISRAEAEYFAFADSITNKAYNVGDGNIGILMKGGRIDDITTASDSSNLEALAKTVTKYLLCYSKK